MRRPILIPWQEVSEMNARSRLRQLPTSSRSALGLTILLALLVSSLVAAQDYEVPGAIPLGEAAPPALVEGSRGTIGDPVPNDGMLNSYVVTAPQGEFTVTTVHGLCKMVREVNAIQKIAVLEKTEAFSDAAVESAKGLGKGAKNLFTKPGKTLKGAAKGAGEMFRDLGDRMSGGEDESSEVEDSSMQQIIGFSKAKRDYAYQFGVDVYSSNETLQKYLNQIAWASFSGGMTFKVATSVATSGLAGAALAVTSTTAALEEVIRDTTPGDLREMTREKLREEGIGEDLINLFIRNEELSPRHQASIAASLVAMEGVEGREYLVRRAANADSYEEGADRVTQAQMYVHIHAKTPLRRFVDIGGDRFVAETADGSIQMAATVDHLAWTENLDQLMQYKNQRLAEQNLQGSRRLWLTGSVSDRAREGLEELDWSVRPGLLEDYVGTLCNPAVPEVTLSEE